MSVARLARLEIRDLHAYEAATQVDRSLRLHANEAPAGSSSLNRYPEVRPVELRSRLAERFGLSPENVLATRGSSEAIDLLVRTFCRSGQDNIVITPPTFGMYPIYAAIQGADTIECPLQAEDDFTLDVVAVIDRCTEVSKLIFICSPNNPTGNVVPQSDIVRLLMQRSGRSIVVVDEAYVEFSEAGSVARLVREFENLVVLRTLSKAYALAGARCGAVIADQKVIDMLDRVLPPYALATPVIDCVLQALSPNRLAAVETRILQTINERERVASELAANPQVQKVWPSQSNFLLVRFVDLDAAQTRLRAERILIRDFKRTPSLAHCARITIGSPRDNDRLLTALNWGMREC